MSMVILTKTHVRLKELIQVQSNIAYLMKLLLEPQPKLKSSKVDVMILHFKFEVVKFLLFDTTFLEHKFSETNTYIKMQNSWIEDNAIFNNEGSLFHYLDMKFDYILNQDFATLQSNPKNPLWIRVLILSFNYKQYLVKCP